MSNVGVRQIYDGTIAEMRKQGSTLEEIGNKCGVSRERIRQVLRKHYPENLHPDGLSTHQLSEYLGVNCHTVWSLCSRLGFVPRKTPHGSGTRAIWDENVLPILSFGIVGCCKICGMPVYLPHRDYCSTEHQLEGTKYKYRSPEAKKRILTAIRSWMRRNPDKQKVIQKRSTDNYRKKNPEKFKAYARRYRMRQLASHKYEIRKNCSIPVGTIVECAGLGKFGQVYVKYNGSNYFLNPGSVRMVSNGESNVTDIRS